MGIEHPKYKVAVVQAAPAWLDLDASVDKTIALIEEAAAKGAKLIAFPEAFIPGYPWYIWLDSPAWAIGRGFVQRYFDNSLAYDSPQAERLRLAVKEAGITAVLGLSEREGAVSIWPVAARARRRDHREAAQIAADPCGTHGLWRRRRQRPCGARATRHRPSRRALLLGASAAAFEIRDVCPERAGACRGLAEFFAVRSVCPGAGLGGQQRRLPHLCGGGLVLRAGAMRDRLAGDGRRIVRPSPTSTRCCMPAAALPRSMDRTAARLPKNFRRSRKGCSMPTSISARSASRRTRPIRPGIIRGPTSRGCC